MNQRDSELRGLGSPCLEMGRAPTPSERKHPGNEGGSLDCWLARAVLAGSGNPPLSIALWNGEEYHPAGSAPATTLHFRSRQALLRTILNPDLHFGDLYASGQIEVTGDLLGGLEAVYCAMNARQQPLLARVLSLVRRCRARPNTPRAARHNIHQHYDIDNAFYERWLDRAAMQYTCAYFPDPGMSLEEAQIAKMHHVCRKLRLRPGERVVETGCGWGGLALFMARHYGVHVRACNISREQVRFARERLAGTDLGDRVEYVEDDYRNIDGRYDVFVSVGMLEHVGREHYRELGEVMNRCLKDDGRGLIHSIGRNRANPMNAWIEKRIFPGAYPPTLREMMNIFEPHAFCVLDVENLRLHYARTLEHWQARFEAHAGEFRQKYDEAFVRSWRLYLVGSIAAFNVGALQLFQVVFTRPANNDIPWSRAHLYAIEN